MIVVDISKIIVTSEDIKIISLAVFTLPEKKYTEKDPKLIFPVTSVGTDVKKKKV